MGVAVQPKQRAARRCASTISLPTPCGLHHCRPACVSATHLPLVHQVRLVSNQHDDDVAAALRAHLLHPPLDVEERLPACGRAQGKG